VKDSARIDSLLFAGRAGLLIAFPCACRADHLS
jgi:hypothetical protein